MVIKKYRFVYVEDFDESFFDLAGDTIIECEDCIVNVPPVRELGRNDLVLIM